MRFLLKVSMPMDKGNEVIKSGKLGEIIGSILEEQKPEAAYFPESDGLRTGYIVVNIDDPSQIPAFAEPWFLGLGARVEFHPAMVPDDLMKAGPAIENVVKKYG